MQHVFIIGSKGIPAKYGGYETFVEQLTRRKVNENKNLFFVSKTIFNSRYIFYICEREKLEVI